MKRSPEWEAMSKIDFTLAYDYEVLGDGDVPDSVEHIEVPTLVMVGEKSLPFMHPAADRMAERIPNAQRETVENQAHAAAPDVKSSSLADVSGARRACNVSRFARLLAACMSRPSFWMVSGLTVRYTPA